MFDALVFDMDGTLWNVSESTTLGWNNALSSLNIDRPITVADIQGVTGKPMPECVRILLPGELEKYPNFLKVLSQFEEAAIRKNGGKFYDSLPETLQSLSIRYDLFLVSNCQAWYLDLFFNLSGVKKWFKGYDCYGLSNQNKPEMLKNLKEKYGLANPVYIGDTESDEISAQSAGYTFIHASYGFGKAKNPDMVIHSFQELETLL